MKGAALALAAAALFGVSMPLAKLLLDRVDPWLLAGLLYLGSGLGLFVLAALGRFVRGRGAEAPLGRPGWLWLGGAIAAGGVVAPVLLMFGLAATPASTASLLLNIEVVATALLAWFVFGEQFDRRIALSMAAIALGAAVLSWRGGPEVHDLAGPAAIAAACLAWALDNNLTRKVALADPLVVATAKGTVAGAINVLIAAGLGAPWPAPETAAAAGVVGFLGYGVSLALFVGALRLVGAARTGAYFAVAPFVGAAAGVAALGDPVTVQLTAAAALMGLGVWLHLTEVHDHEHEHAPIEHDHRHVHDQHHRHDHAEPVGPEPHSHPHRHLRLRHRHPHFPDPHHLHEHE